MGKLTKKQGLKLVEQGILTEDAYNAMITEGAVSEGRSAGVKRVIKGTEVCPSLYFKNNKGSELDEGVKAVISELRGKVNDLITEYTVIAD